MSKQLNSILNKLPHATATKTLPSPPSGIDEEKLVDEGNVLRKSKEKMLRIVAPVPQTLKQALKRHILDHPGETEKSLILKGLRTLGFSIADEYIEDQRKNK